MNTYFFIGEQRSKPSLSDTIIVRDGFSFLAALFAPFWFLWRGMWLHALCVFLFETLLIAISSQFQMSELVMGLLFMTRLLIAFWIGLEANYFYVEHLKHHGGIVLDQVFAADKEMAQELYRSRLIDKHAEFDFVKAEDNRVISSYDKTYKGDMIFSKNWGAS